MLFSMVIVSTTQTDERFIFLDLYRLYCPKHYETKKASLFFTAIGQKNSVIDNVKMVNHKSTREVLDKVLPLSSN